MNPAAPARQSTSPALQETPTNAGQRPSENRNRLLHDLRSQLSGRKVLLMGVGNRLRGDDGLGPALIERLVGKVRVPLLDAGDVPENYLGPIEASGANLVLTIDAVDFGGRPGDVALIPESQVKESTLSTHTGSLNLLLRAIPTGKRPAMLILAVQPAQTVFGNGLSEEVERSLGCLEHTLASALG